MLEHAEASPVRVASRSHVCMRASAPPITNAQEDRARWSRACAAVSACGRVAVRRRRQRRPPPVPRRRAFRPPVLVIRRRRIAGGAKGYKGRKERAPPHARESAACRAQRWQYTSTCRCITTKSPPRCALTMFIMPPTFTLARYCCAFCCRSRSRFSAQSVCIDAFVLKSTASIWSFFS